VITLKTKAEISKMREAGRILASILERLVEMVEPGIRTNDLEMEARRMMKEAQVEPAFLGQPGLVADARPYPAVLCVSVNEEVIHGIPSNRKINEGDLVSIDCGVVKDGLIADAAVSVIAGDAQGMVKRLVECTRQALHDAIKQARAGAHLHDISYAIQRRAESEGFGVVREFCGHGVGRSLHEDPPVPNQGKPGTGPVLRAGMTIAIEPMITMGSPKVQVLLDKWTVVTADGLPAAHFEHTIAITDDEPLVLTRGEKGLW
jgi:methionyl aminopeptidase